MGAKVVVKVLRGLVESVEGRGLPCPIDVVIKDYDIHGDARIYTDSDGKEYQRYTLELEPAASEAMSDDIKANLRLMLVFYREAVIFYREEAARIKRGDPLRDPAINRPDCAEVILRTYRLCIRTMLGLEE